MFLARREFGKTLRIYPLKTTDSPCAWLFDGVHPETLKHTAAALHADTYGGAAGTGNTRSEALSNLHIAEEAAVHA